MTDLFVTNFNPNFTGVSSTAATVLRQQIARYDLSLVGVPLPGCPEPISVAAARAATRTARSKPFAIWHVRRNPEMRAAIWARDVLRLPLKTVFTSAAQRRHSAYPRWLISKMDAVIATTDAAANHMGDNLRAMVPHGVDCDVFSPAEDRAAAWRRLGYGGARGIATIGRVRPEKGTDLFVDTMLRSLPELSDVHALIVGKASEKHKNFEQSLKDKVAAAGLADRIHFVGEVAPDSLPDLMRSLSLVVQLPRYEGFGMVPLEGMASGVPFVGSDTGYYRSFSAQSRAGEVAALEDSAAAAAYVLSILSDHAYFDRMARSATDIARHSFSAQREADGIDAVYQQLWSKC